jgi:hypothetical protein
MNKNYVCNNRKCRYHDTTMIIHCARSISAEDDRPYALVCRRYTPPERGNEGCPQRMVRKYEVRGNCFVPCEVTIEVEAESADDAIKKALAMRWQDHICNGYDESAAFEWEPYAREINAANT